MSGNSENNQKCKGPSRLVRNESRRKEGWGPILEGTDIELGLILWAVGAMDGGDWHDWS